MQEIVKIIILHGGQILDVGEVSEGVARLALSGLYANANHSYYHSHLWGDLILGESNVVFIYLSQ